MTRKRMLPTKMWAECYEGLDFIRRPLGGSITYGKTPSKRFKEKKVPVMVLDYRDWLELRRAAKRGKVKKGERK